MKIYLIRHAESAPDFEIPEARWPLSRDGKRQARELATATDGLDLTAVYSSPYCRSTDTVRPLAKAHGLDIRVEQDLREKKLTDEYLADFEVHVERSWSDVDYRLPGGESSRQARRRGVCALERIIAGHAMEDQIVVGSHGNLIGLILSNIAPDFGYEDWAAMGNPDVFLLRWTGELAWDRTAVYDGSDGRLLRQTLRMTPSERGEELETIADLRAELDAAQSAQERLLINGRLGDRLRLNPDTVEEAIAHLRKAVDRCSVLRRPDLKIANSLRLAIALQYADRHHEAIPLFRRVLEEIHQTSERKLEDYALQHLGKCLAELNRLDEAKTRLREALKLRRLQGDQELIDSTTSAIAMIDTIRQT